MGAPKATVVRRLIPALLILLTLAFFGCAKPAIKSGKSDDHRPAAAADPLREAENAYVSGKFSQAENLALRLSSDPATQKDRKIQALRLLAASALKNNHPSLALSALDDWSKSAPGLDGETEWQDALGRTLRALPSNEARTRAGAIYQDSARSQSARSAAGTILAVRQWADGDLGRSLSALENIYGAAPDGREKAALERRLALELHLADASASSLAAGSVNAENRSRFPYNVILIDKLRRDSLDRAKREEALASLRTLAAELKPADPSLLSGPPTESEISIRSSGGAAATGPIGGQPVVLLLPLSGQ
ncbi:MAG: hypothetical protein LBB52_05380, partial [Desulfovibrio sp.]|nr:hypothetical protein [Desulfovibrio sp.]